MQGKESHPKNCFAASDKPIGIEFSFAGSDDHEAHQAREVYSRLGIESTAGGDDDTIL
jgi:hypothetical protein